MEPGNPRVEILGGKGVDDVGPILLKRHDYGPVGVLAA